MPDAIPKQRVYNRTPANKIYCFLTRAIQGYSLLIFKNTIM